MNAMTLPLSRKKTITLLNAFIADVLPKKQWFLSCKPFMNAAVFYGSRAKNNHRADSDIDILIFMPLAVEKKYTRGEYVYNYYGHHINIVIRSIERLRRIAAFREKDLFEAEIFRMAEIIWQKDTEVAQLIKKII
ncbi:MAG: nucleotidyltransferase domain-containing protein [Candidatus Woesearchaeota archaeon]